MKLQSKLISSFLVMIMTLFSLTISASASAKYADVMIKSSLIDEGSYTFRAKLINNRTYVDLSGVLAFLPYVVNSKAISFNSETKTLKIYSNDLGENHVLLQFHVGDDFFYSEQEKVELDGSIRLIDNRIYIPLKGVTSLNHLNVAFDQKTKTITVTE